MQFFAVKTSSLGIAFSKLFYNFVMLPLLPWLMGNPIAKWIYDLIFERIFSYAIAKGILTFNIFAIEKIVDKEVVKYLHKFDNAKNLPEDASKKEKNRVANELFDVSEQLISNHRPDGLLQQPS